MRKMAMAFAVVCVLGQGGQASELDLDWDLDLGTSHLLSLPDIGPMPSLEAFGGNVTYTMSPGFLHTDTTAEDLTIRSDLATFTSYTKRIDLNDGPIALQPLIQRSSWWSVAVGSGTVDTPGASYDGSAITVSGVAMGLDGVGARFSFGETKTNDEELVLGTREFAVLIDYMRGGRIGLYYGREDVSTLFLLFPIWPVNVIIPTERYGVDVTHVADMGEGAISFHLSVGRQEQEGAAGTAIAEEYSEDVTWYLTKSFGIRGYAKQIHGEIADKDSYGGGIVLDLEQVALSITGNRVDNHEPGAASSDEWSVGLELRF